MQPLLLLSASCSRERLAALVDPGRASSMRHAATRAMPVLRCIVKTWCRGVLGEYAAVGGQACVGFTLQVVVIVMGRRAAL
jgi:hypothetical protein